VQRTQRGAERSWAKLVSRVTWLTRRIFFTARLRITGQTSRKIADKSRAKTYTALHPSYYTCANYVESVCGQRWSDQRRAISEFNAKEQRAWRPFNDEGEKGGGWEAALASGPVAFAARASVCLAWLMGKKIQLRPRATAITFSDYERARGAETRDRRSFGALSMRVRS